MRLLGESHPKSVLLEEKSRKSLGRIFGQVYGYGGLRRPILLRGGLLGPTPGLSCGPGRPLAFHRLTDEAVARNGLATSPTRLEIVNLDSLLSVLAHGYSFPDETRRGRGNGGHTRDTWKVV